MRAGRCRIEKSGTGFCGEAQADDAAVRCGALEVSAEGHIRWTAGEGAALLAAYCPSWGQGSRTLPLPVQAWLARGNDQRRTSRRSPDQTFCLGTGKAGALLCLRMIPNGRRWLLWLEERGQAAGQSGSAQAGLTRREREVFKWIVQGKTNGDIGLILGISPRTVQKHAERIYEKLGVETRVAAMACRLGEWTGLPAHHAPSPPMSAGTAALA